MVTPAAKRKAVAHLVGIHGMSERRACKAIGCCRMTVRYQTSRSDDAGLRQRMRAIAHERRRFGGASTSCSSVRAIGNGRLRDELLNEMLFTSLAQARVALRCWRADYNDARPHSQLGWQTPSEFTVACNPRRDLALRYVEGSAPAPATTHMGTSNRPNEFRPGIKLGDKVRGVGEEKFRNELSQNWSRGKSCSSISSCRYLIKVLTLVRWAPRFPGLLENLVGRRLISPRAFREGAGRCHPSMCVHRGASPMPEVPFA